MQQDVCDTIVVGAGISGLSAGWFLKQAGLNVRVIESQDRCGGVIQTHSRDGFIFEYGPNSTLAGRPELHALIRGLGLESELISANKSANSRYILKNGSLTPLPLNPAAFFTSRLLSAAAKLRAMAEPFIARQKSINEESVANFFERRLGPGIANNIVDPFIAGIYAANPSNLSLQHCFPKLAEYERNSGSIVRGALAARKKRAGNSETASQRGLVTFRQGMQTLTDSLHQALDDAVLINSSCQQVARSADGFMLTVTIGGEEQELFANSVIMTVPGYAYNRIKIHADVKIDHLSQIEYAPLSIVITGYETKSISTNLEGFGFLTPTAESRQVLGSIWNSSIFEHRSPSSHTLFTTFVGGARQPHLSKLNREHTLELVHQELSSILGELPEPGFADVFQHTKAIPQYKLGYGKVISEIAAIERSMPGFVVGGNIRDGVSVADCVANSAKHAENIVAYLSNTRRDLLKLNRHETVSDGES